MLGRQWQFGELIGEDAGSIVAVSVASQALPVTAWAPLAGGRARRSTASSGGPGSQGALLEELVQDVPALSIGSGLRQRAEAGASARRPADGCRRDGARRRARSALSSGAGRRSAVPGRAAAGRVRVGAGRASAPVAARDALDPTARPLLEVLAGAVPDGAAILADLRGAEPAWVADASDPRRGARAARGVARRGSKGIRHPGGAW